jgi:MFS family permease
VPCLKQLQAQQNDTETMKTSKVNSGIVEVSIADRNRTTATIQPDFSRRQIWSAVGSMTLCVAMLIGSEFMPVSLLTPIAADLRATEGMAGQAISVSGLFAVVTSLFIATIAGHLDRRHVLIGLTVLMLVSLILIAEAQNFAMLMLARALLGMTIGGFWSLATATIMRLVPEGSVPKALGVMYTGNAVATAFAAPIGSYLGGIIGWRGVFWALVPIVLVNLIWQWMSLPAMPPRTANPVGKLFGLLKRRNVAFAMLAVMLTFAGAFATFTYLRPFLETYTRVNVPQLSLLLLGLGLAGFIRGQCVAWAAPLFVAQWAADGIGRGDAGPARNRLLFMGGGGHDDCLGNSELGDPSGMVHLALERHHRRAGKRRWANGSSDTALNYAGCGIRGIASGPHLDCGNADRRHDPTSSCIADRG